MITPHTQNYYSHRVKLYQLFLVDFLRWGKVLGTFFQQNSYLHSQMKILDAGCGTGVVIRVLHEHARQKSLTGIIFHAFDLTPAILELFRKWVNREAAQDIHLLQADPLELQDQLPPDWAGYNLIVSSTLL